MPTGEAAQEILIALAGPDARLRDDQGAAIDGLVTHRPGPWWSSAPAGASPRCTPSPPGCCATRRGAHTARVSAAGCGRPATHLVGVHTGVVAGHKRVELLAGVGAVERVRAGVREPRGTRASAWTSSQRRRLQGSSVITRTCEAGGYGAPQSAAGIAPDLPGKDRVRASLLRTLSRTHRALYGFAEKGIRPRGNTGYDTLA